MDSSVPPLELPGAPMEHRCGSLGDSCGGGLAKEDFERKTSELAEPFIKKWSGGPQNSSASTIFFQEA